MAKAARTHKITVSVTFNRPISKANALREFKDKIHGKFFTNEGWVEALDGAKYPGEFKIGTAKIAKENTNG